MKTKILPAKISDMVNSTISNLMVAFGTVTLIWILALLIVALVEK